jgi:hypothetical protein
MVASAGPGAGLGNARLASHSFPRFSSPRRPSPCLLPQNWELHVPKRKDLGANPWILLGFKRVKDPKKKETKKGKTASSTAGGSGGGEGGGRGSRRRPKTPNDDERRQQAADAAEARMRGSTSV